MLRWGSCYHGGTQASLVKTLGLHVVHCSGTLTLQHLSQQTANLIDGQLLPADVLLLVFLVLRSFDRDVRKLAGKQDRGLEPGQCGIARSWAQCPGQIDASAIANPKPIGGSPS